VPVEMDVLSERYLNLLREFSPSPETVRKGLKLSLTIEVLRSAFRGLPVPTNVIRSIERAVVSWMEQHPDHEITKRNCDLLPIPKPRTLPTTWEEL
jgi:hypothetical protein